MDTSANVGAGFSRTRAPIGAGCDSNKPNCRSAAPAKAGAYISAAPAKASAYIRSTKASLVLLLAFLTSPFLLEDRRQVPATDAAATSSIVYRVTFPEPEHHWMQVEVT